MDGDETESSNAAATPPPAVGWLLQHLVALHWFCTINPRYGDVRMPIATEQPHPPGEFDLQRLNAIVPSEMLHSGVELEAYALDDDLRQRVEYLERFCRERGLDAWSAP